MKKIQKAVSLFLVMAFLLAIPGVGYAADAQQTTTMSLKFADNAQKTSMSAGTPQTFDVYFANNPQFDGLEIIYEVYQGTDTSEGNGKLVTDKFTHGETWVTDGTLSDVTGENHKFTWYDSKGKPTSATGKVFSFTLTADNSLVDGTYTIKLNYNIGTDGVRDHDGFAITGENESTIQLPVTFEELTFTLTGAVSSNMVIPQVTVTPATNSYSYPTTADGVTELVASVQDGLQTDSGASLQYEWYKVEGQSETQIEGAATNKYTPELPSTPDGVAVTYKCKVTNTYDSETYSGNGSATVSYNKGALASVTVANASGLKYDGTAKELTFEVKDGATTAGTVAADQYTVTVNDSTGNAVSDNKPINAGTYTVEVAPTESSNYTGTPTTTVTIAQANYTVTQNPSTTIYLYDGAPDVEIGSDILSVKTAGSTAAEIDRSKITYTSGDPSKVTIVNGKLRPVAVGEANVTATIAGDDNHNGTTATIKVTVSAKEDVSRAVTFNAQSGPFTYDPQEKALSTYVQAATISDGTLTNNPKDVVYRLDGEVVTDLNVTKALDAGKHTFTATFEDDTKIGVGTVEITIEKAELEPTVTWKAGGQNYSDSSFTYDGNEKTVTADVGSEDKVQVTPGDGCTGTNAGDYTAHATVSVKGEYATNYKLKDGYDAAKTLNWKIAKATNTLSANVAEQSVRYNDNSVKSIAASAITFTGTAPAGVEIKSVTSGTDSSSIIADTYPKFDETSKTAQYQLKGVASFTAGQSYTFTIGYSTTNYEDGTVQVTVTVVDKYVVDDQVSFSPEAPTTTYNGTAQAVSSTAATFTGRADGAGAITYKYSTDNGSTWTDTAPTDAGTYKVQATYEDNSQRGKAEAAYTINPASLTITGATVTAKDYDTTTTAAVSAVTFDGTKNNESLTTENGYTATGAFADANAGENKSVTVTVELKADGTVSKNYTLSSNTFTTTGTINKKSVTAALALTPASSAFNNAVQTPTVKVTYDPSTEMAASEYTVTYAEGRTDVGTYAVTVAPKDSSNYTFTALNANFEITKATATIAATVNATGKAGTDVTVKLPELTNPGTDPAVAYAAQAATDGNGILDGDVSISGSTLTCKIASTATEGQTATIPVKITSQNYTDTTVNVVVTATEKNIPQVTAQDLVKTFNNAALTLDEITKSNGGVAGEWSFVGDVSGVKNANTMPYDVTLKFTPTDTDAYAAVEVQIKVTINKATPTVTAACTPITTTGKTLADATISCTVTPNTIGSSIAWDDDLTTVVVANQSYGWTYTPADTTNYETVKGTLIPFVQEPENPDDDVNYPVTPPVIVDPLPGNGGGGNGGGGTTTNPNEPNTTTTTDSQGNVTTTTTYPDGSETKVEKKADGTVITTEVDPEGNKSSTVENTDGSTMTTVENVDGSSSFVSTDANGKTSAVVELPAKTVEDANTTGRPAALPMDSVTATTDSATAPVVTVNTANEEPVKVEIPVSNAGNGTVAVLVKADGTEEIIKTTIPTADGIAVTLNSGESVKVVDNSKYFSDTARHWGSDAVDFVSARELFGGTGENKFSPDDAMTRGMLMTVLARFENVDTAGGATWYEKGVAWAVTQGLSDGTNPNGRITREQLATIIYRYAQSKGVNTTAGGSLERFPDAGRVSDWAMEAMSWCVAEGIISGVGGATLDPAGNATRAQVATIIMRYAEKFAA